MLDAKKKATSPIRLSVTRIEEVFEKTNPFQEEEHKIIKDYVYLRERRIIA